MNKIFKIVFNAARGKMMVVNEATSSVQTGKKAAVTVAVIGALVASSAMAEVGNKYTLYSLTKDTTIQERVTHGVSNVTVNGVQKPQNRNEHYSHVNLNGYTLTFEKGFGDEGQGIMQSPEVGRECLTGFVLTGSEGSKIIVESGGIHGFGNINVDTLEVTTNSDHAIHSQGLGNTSANALLDYGVETNFGINVNAKTVYLKSIADNVIQVDNASGNDHGGKLTFGSLDKRIESMTIDASKGERPIRVTGKDDFVKIYADKLNIIRSEAMPEEAIKADGGSSIIIDALTADINSDIEAGSNGTIEMTLGANSALTGNVSANKGGDVTLALGAGSVLNGSLRATAASKVNVVGQSTADINVTLDDENAISVSSGEVSVKDVESFTVAGSTTTTNAITVQSPTADSVGKVDLTVGTFQIQGSYDAPVWGAAAVNVHGGNFTLTADTVNVDLEKGTGLIAQQAGNNAVGGSIVVNAGNINLHAENGVGAQVAIYGQSNTGEENNTASIVLNATDSVSIVSVTSSAVQLKDYSPSSVNAGKTSVDISATNDIYLEGYFNGLFSKHKAESDISESVVKVNSSNGDVTIIGKGEGGWGAVELYASEGSIKAENGKVKLESELGYGAKVTNGLLDVAAQEVVIEAATEGVHAVNGDVSIDAGTVSVSSTTNVGVRLNDSNFEVTADKAVITSESNWHGVRADNSTATIDADIVEVASQYAGVYAEYGSQVTLGNEESTSVKIDVAGQGEDSEVAGLWARNPGSSVTVNGSYLEVNVSDPEHQYVYGLLAQGMTTTGTPVTFVNVNSDNAVINSTGVGIMSTGDGEVNLNSKSSITVDAPVAIEVRNGAKVNVNTGKDAKADVVLNGNVDFHQAYEGDDITAEVTLVLNTAKSVWTGNALASWKEGLNPTAENFEGAKLNLTLANGAQWNPVAIEKLGQLEDEKTQVATFALRRNTSTGGQFQLDVNNLTLEGGVINLEDGVQVGVDNMGGSGGTLNLGTQDGQTQAALNVGQLDDKTKLDVNLMNSDLTKELTSDDLTPEQTQELLKNVAGGSANVTTEVQEGMYNDGYTSNGKDGVVATKTNSVMSNTLDLASAAPLAMNRLLMNDVRKRMGDLRSAEGTHGVWARYDGGKLSGANGLENDFTTVQVGIDTVPVADAPRFGVAFSYTQSDADMKRGGAEMDAFSLAFYGTKMYDNGMFVDVIGRMATADTDVTVEGQKGTMDNVALSLSGELGWRFDVTEKFFFEPQAELTYTYVNADKLALGNSSYEFDAVDSLMGRVGFAAGFKCPSNFGNVYVRASVVHEFLGDAAVTGANGTVHNVDGKDTWVEYGIGANFNVNKNTYVYADIERTEGAALEEDWRAHVGVRFAF